MFDNLIWATLNKLFCPESVQTPRRLILKHIFSAGIKPCSPLQFTWGHYWVEINASKERHTSWAASQEYSSDYMFRNESSAEIITREITEYPHLSFKLHKDVSNNI